MDWLRPEEGQYATATISVPLDLKQRIEAVEEEVNWSAVACRAFEFEVGAIASRKEHKTPDEIIARLRAAKLAEAEADYREGETDGRKWAADYPDVHDLERLERVRAQDGPEWRSLFEACASRYDPAIRLSEILFTEQDMLIYQTREVPIRFWDNVACRNVPGNESYVRGFADGVLAVWIKVKDQVNA